MLEVVSPENPSAHYCYTASGFLIHQGKVLLILHKKLLTWLAPGGHIEESESPEEAAVREFWEETGLRVEVISYPLKELDINQSNLRGSDFHPLPMLIDSHWVCQENYQRRIKALKEKKDFIPDKKWSKGCEKHLNLSFLLRLKEGENLEKLEAAVEEVLDIAFFSLTEIQELLRQGKIYQGIYSEITLAFKLVASREL